MTRTLFGSLLFGLVACASASDVSGEAISDLVTHWIPCSTVAQCNDANHCTVDTCQVYGGRAGPG